MTDSLLIPIDEPTLEKGINLFWGSGSPFARRVQMALIEKKLPYKSHLLRFDRGDLKTDWFKKYNARSEIPTLIDDGAVVSESIGIIQYLEHFYPEVSLLPKDKKWRGIVLTRIHEVDGALKTASYGLYNRTLYAKQAYSLEEVNEAREAIFKELDRWETYLKNEQVPYFGGPDFSLADIAVFPIVAQLVDRYGMPLKGNPRFPLLSKWFEVVSSRDSAKDSVPPHWKETTVAALFEKTEVPTQQLTQFIGPTTVQ